jgi:hypothetical protein
LATRSLFHTVALAHTDFAHTDYAHTDYGNASHRPINHSPKIQNTCNIPSRLYHKSRPDRCQLCHIDQHSGLMK